ncbi:asparagine synthase (glutamine-hydrolyzing) [Herminiimonas contaminans]|uniref:asparagine synthase (glutamine-hydrolyzing) n=1 Tax=Herminiimonas contaminans TaxID=1111140 RepID=A0ABS0ERK2_9BURK|nr:asparagine synthase (glutamine-hydrolyzing) [Herminiimonas contaminans]MBF8176684.1 asparagine synthase (glutamine-hydrolyzing) [Herminiimonas contaminans]
MCGILGGVWRGTSPLASQFDKALEALRFRGPNDSGIERFECGPSQVVLGHTRLSIIDLSSAGHQPMETPDGRYSIIFNGEIYNYLELRTELKTLGHTFSSDSDTEVLLVAWRQWGAECLQKLVGMFAFVVLDKAALTLTCVRDAFGIKPFFYTQEQETFLFASEIPAIKSLKREKLTVNWQRSYDYLVHGEYDSRAESFIEGIAHLQAGHLLQVDLTTGKHSEPRKWWIPSVTERTDLSFGQAVELVRERFLDSIRLHLRSDVAIGAALSGGVDSSAVVCAMRYLEPDLPINTFSFIAADSRVNEEKWIDIINRHVGAKAHKVSITADELVRDIDTLIHAQGEPFGSMSIYAQYRVYQLAKENGVTVTLDGQGADEAHGGYTGFPGERIRSLLDRGHFGEAATFLANWAKWPGRSVKTGLRAALAELSTGLSHEMMRALAGMNQVPDWIRSDVAKDMGIVGRIERYRSGHEASGRRVVAQMSNMLTRHGLPALLRHGDRNSMRFSVESRVPFLTLDQVELMLSMPERFLVSPSGETKHLFRAAMKGIVPDEVLFRKDKIGFEPPEKEWILSIAGQARTWLSEDMQIPFIRRDMLLAQFDDVIAGRRAFSWQVWRWINFYRWKACVAD